MPPGFHNKSAVFTDKVSRYANLETVTVSDRIHEQENSGWCYAIGMLSHTR